MALFRHPNGLTHPQLCYHYKIRIQSIMFNLETNSTLDLGEWSRLWNFTLVMTEALTVDFSFLKNRIDFSFDAPVDQKKVADVLLAMKDGSVDAADLEFLKTWCSRFIKAMQKINPRRWEHYKHLAEVRFYLGLTEEERKKLAADESF